MHRCKECGSIVHSEVEKAGGKTFAWSAMSVLLVVALPATWPLTDRPVLVFLYLAVFAGALWHWWRWELLKRTGS